MTSVTRRNLILGATMFGAGGVTAFAACRGAVANTSQPGSDPSPRGDRFGAGVYNTQQVADELGYLEEHVRPAGEKRYKRILITGSTAGLGQLAAAHLLNRGHRVVAHTQWTTRRRNAA